MAHHEEDDNRRFTEITDLLIEMKEDRKQEREEEAKWREDFLTMMTPIKETYDTAGRLGRWSKGTLTVLALILTIVVTGKQLGLKWW